jgi:transposase InsO family protein
LQARIRRRAVRFYQVRRRQGRSLGEIAGRLRLRARTLRHWDYAYRTENRRTALLGRPKARSEYRQRQNVIEVLKAEGPQLGVPSLCGLFPGMARAELAELLQRYRRVLRLRYHHTIHVCHWPITGRVWAMDLAEPSAPGAEESLPPIDGCYPYLLAVRDLASGYQLAWLPLKEGTAEAVRRVLAYLFARHGTPLVVKCDNGPPFRAEEMKAWLATAGALPLYSPPYYPEYNGAVEAGIGSLKRRTELQAARHGRIDNWTWDDIEAACQEANERPAVLSWTSRTPISNCERVHFDLTAERERILERTQQQYALEDHLDHWCSSEVDRKAIARALVEHGYLLYSRRRIPLTIKPRKVTNIM